MKEKLTFQKLLVGLVISGLFNLILLGILFHKYDYDKKFQLEMSVKCSEYLPQLKKEDEKASVSDSESMTVQETEVFYSPVKKACLSFRKEMILSKKEVFKINTVKNLFTNETILFENFIVSDGNSDQDFKLKVQDLKVEK